MNITKALTDEEQAAAYDESLENLRTKRKEARVLARSGHPARRSQGKLLLASLPLAFKATHRMYRREVAA